MMHLLWVGLAVAPSASACLWDDDTLRDELKNNLSDFDLITGQIPHHGKAYYQHRVAVLSATKLDHGSRNDLAVAYIRLERFDEAEALLLENLKGSPGDYFTISNLGVLEKKRGNFPAAAGHIERALAIRPEGHLGLGDWYLKMLEFRATWARSTKEMPPANFLGVDYNQGIHRILSTGDGVPAVSTEESLHYDKLRRLLQNDQSFADGFAAMGDYLARRGDLHLAFLAYTRAITLEHPNDSQMRGRRRAILSEWESASDETIRNLNAFRREQIAIAEGHHQKAAAWIEQFQSVEAKIVKATNTLPAFEETLRRMDELKIARYRPAGK